MVRAATAIHRRHGFTLIELLLVMAIIGLLSALTLGVVLRLLGTGVQAQASTEIRELAQALETFKSAYPNVRYIPSKLILRRNMLTYNTSNPATITWGTTTYQPTSQEESRSLETLTAMFGRQAMNNTNMIWTGNSNDTAPVNTGWVLFGPECLVFFTGGVMSDGSVSTTVAPLGFSTNSANPLLQGGTRKGPFYPNFKSNRLVPALYLDPIKKKYVATGFYQYQDPFESGPNAPGQPYAFFSSYGGGATGNDYNTNNINAKTASLGDCYTLPAGSTVAKGLLPYFDTNQKFYNPNGYQIISAGPDLAFGPGGLVNSKTGDSTANGTGDNLTNFSGGRLLAPIN